MLAIRQRAFGGPDQLRLEEVAEPRPSVDQVRIRVAAAGVHLIDAGVRRGERAGPLGVAQLPMTPGREVFGVVDEVGPGAPGGLMGERVVANLGPASGGYSELAVADVEQLHRVPDSVSGPVAVAMIGTGRTAMAIAELAGPVRGDVAVIAAAAGGIGSLLVELASAAGATVVGLAGGPAKVAAVEALGVTAVDSAEDRWASGLARALTDSPATLGLEGVGGTVGRTVLESLGVGGRMVMYGSASGSLTPIETADLYARGISVAAAIGARLFQRPGGLRGLESRALDAAATGALNPLFTEFPLAEAGEAQRSLETRTSLGKVILTL